MLRCVYTSFFTQEIHRLNDWHILCAVGAFYPDETLMLNFSSFLTFAIMSLNIHLPLLTFRGILLFFLYNPYRIVETLM